MDPTGKEQRSAFVSGRIIRWHSSLRRLLCIGTVVAFMVTLAQGGNAYAGVGRAPVTTLTWEPEGALSNERYALAAATARNGSIYVIGGANTAGTSRTVEVYPPNTKRWLAGPSLPAPRYRLAAATGGDGRIYAIGGSDPGGAGPFLASVLAL